MIAVVIELAVVAPRKRSVTDGSWLLRYEFCVGYILVVHRPAKTNLNQTTRSYPNRDLK